MWGIRFNNRRDWFLAHKADYQTYFYEPLKELAAEVQERILSDCPGRELNLKVARIYRDARIVRDGRPYKDHLWFSLRQPWEERSGHPSLFFGVEPEGCSFGMDYWCAKPSQMEKYRKKMLREPEKLEKLARKLNRRKEFTLCGEEYKRSKGECPALLKPWFNRKYLWIERAMDYEEGSPFFSPALADEITEGLEWLLPFFDWFEELAAEPEE